MDVDDSQERQTHLKNPCDGPERGRSGRRPLISGGNGSRGSWGRRCNCLNVASVPGANGAPSNTDFAHHDHHLCSFCPSFDAVCCRPHSASRRVELRSTTESKNPNRCRGIKPPRTILENNTNNFQPRVCLVSSCCASQISRRAMRNAERYAPRRNFGGLFITTALIENKWHMSTVSRLAKPSLIPGVTVLLFSPNDGLSALSV